MAALAALSTIQQQPFTVASHLLPLPDSTSGLAGATTPPPTAVVSTPQRQTSSSGTSGSTNAAESGTPFRFPRSSSPIDPVYVNRYALQHERPVDFTIQTVPQSSYSSHLPPRLNRQSNVQLSTLDSLDSPGSLTLTSPVSPELQRRLLDDLQRQLDLCCSDTDSDSEPDEREYTNVPIPVCLALVVGYICGGAFLFLELQQSWNFEESAYFCFITLTTIGFGDYLPKAEDIAIRDSKGALILCSLYTILGMAWIAMCFNLVQEEVARIVKSFATMIGLVSKQHDR